MNIMKKLALSLALLFLLTGTAFAADQTIAATEEMVGSGHATKSDTLNRLGLVGHNTDGTHKAGLGDLLNGAANLKAFMNAAGTAPEWAAGIGLISATRDMTAAGAPTDVAYTGLGFKPSAAIFFATVPGTSMMSIGFVVPGGAQGVIDDDSSGGAGATNWNLRSSEVIDLCQTFNSVRQDAAWKSFDTDGLTLTWTKSGSPSANTAILRILCFR
jgi:hypothetical protein